MKVELTEKTVCAGREVELIKITEDVKEDVYKRQVQETPFVELKHISKSFPGVKVLEDISIPFYRGKVHVLLGENGAGKSTIIKMISGIYQPDELSLIHI